MDKNFSDLGITPPILKAIEEMGFEMPTEVQSKVIPHILNQEDLIVMSKTGSGKTAVFGIPLLQMTDPDVIEPQGLILTPTRELAVQIDNDLKRMSAYLPHQTTAVYGQHSMNLEIQALKKGASLVTGTPGRVYDHIRHGNLKVKKIRYLVLDEADRMLDMGFIDQVFKIIKTLPKNRITLLFSATIPAEIQSICRGYMNQPVKIEIESQTKTVDTINQVYYRMNKNEKRTQLHRMLMIERPESCLIFCNTRYAVDQVQKFLSTKGYASQAIHGDVPQGKRLNIMQQFKKGDLHLLVATDVAARGIHIDDLALVINYDVPLEKDNYVHRIGRTGRAGKGGRAITFVTGDDIMSLYEIEEHIGAQIAESDLPSDSDINGCKAEAEKWIKEKFQSSVLASTSASRETQDNKSQGKEPGTAPGKKRRRRRRPGQGASDAGENSQIAAFNPPRPDAPKEPRRDIPREPRQSASQGHSRPAQTRADRPVQERSDRNRPDRPARNEHPRPAQSNRNEHPKPAQSAEPAPQPSGKASEPTRPFLQRMLKKLLSK